MVRRAAGLVVKVTADPFRDLLVKSHWIERAPVKENDPATAFHLPFDDLQMIADVERMILFLPVGAVGS